ncbi:MAG: alpha/beta family hydrolase [Gemmatimonadales bacterium]
MNHLLEVPEGAKALYVLAHGAGAGMRHPFMDAIARVLAARGIGTFRYEFGYMEKKSRRPDAPTVAMARVREAVAEAQAAAPGLPLLAGGKSFGGRMTSNAQAESPLPGVLGLVFLGFPLHPPGKPSIARADHLDRVEVPMLFVQGTKDEFAQPALLAQVLGRVGPRASLHAVEGGNHSFAVPKSTGRSKDDVLAELGDAITGWAARLS